MSEELNFTIRLSKVMREFNVGKDTIVEFLAKKGFQIDSAPNTKLSEEMYTLLSNEFQVEKSVKDLSKRLGKLSYRGGSVSVESTTEDNERKRRNKKSITPTTSDTEPTNEKNQDEKEILVSLGKLHFSTNAVSLKYNSIEFVLLETGISGYLNFEKSFLKLSTKVVLDYSNKTFRFLDFSLLSNLKDLSIRLTREDEIKREREEKRKQKKVQIQKEKEKKAIAKAEKEQKKKLQKEANRQAREKRQLRMQKEKERLQVQKNITEKKILSKTKPQTQLPVSKSMTLRAGNIRFYNEYYLIFQTNNGEIDNTIAPYRVDNPNSNEILNLVHKYFEQILEQKRIIVEYDETKILEPSRLDLFQLSNYVRDLKRNLDVKGAWWKEVQNDRKPSLSKCRKISSEIVKKKVSLKNGYLDNLASMQSEKKLISVYEVNHGKEEDAFIFTISMSNNRCAVIFENASNDVSTTTWAFVTKIENYESCVNLVFDYFTDYTIIKKRKTLRVKTINPPEKYKAEDYTFIDHDDLGQWLKKLNRILENDTQPSDIAFIPGLHIPESSETRTGHGDTIITKHLHNQLMRKLYDSLCVEHGKDNVGTEIRVGTKRIDTVVKGDGFYDIYEIKTAENPFECVTEALGQLCQYTYLFCRDKIGKMIIVGPSKMTKEVKDYLSWFRKNYFLQLYYMKV